MTLAPLTPADKVTVGRAALGVVGAVLVVVTLIGILPTRSWVLPLVFAPAFALDAVDGAVARRTGTVTERGARWDIEVDTATALVASLAVVSFAPWALTFGLARYLYLVAGRVRSWSGALPPRRSRRPIGGFQGVALVVAMTPIVPIWLAQAVIGLALALVVVSFARDIVYQERRLSGTSSRS